MTKSELLKILEKYPDNIEVQILVSGRLYDINDYSMSLDVDTNIQKVTLSNKENENKYVENMINKLRSK